MRRIFALGAVLALCAGLLFGAAAVSGKNKKANSNLSVGIGFVSGTGFPFFQGTVKSGKGGCVQGRRVTVAFQRNRGKSTFFGRAKTDANGFWTVFMQTGMRTGGYFAKVKKTGKCRYDETNPVAVAHNSPLGIRALRALR